MATFRPSVEAWRDVVARHSTGIAPVDFVLSWIDRESGGNVCSLGIPGVEAGLFQTYHPSDDRFGATFDQLRSACSGSTQVRPLLPEEMETQVRVGLNLIKSLKDRARAMLDRVGIGWSQASTDFWSFVKLGHGLPAMQSDLLPIIVAQLGRAPRNWSEFAAAALALPANQYPPSLVAFAVSPSTGGRQNRVADVLANAEHAGAFGGLPLPALNSPIGLAVVFGGGSLLLYLLWQRTR